MAEITCQKYLLRLQDSLFVVYYKAVRGVLCGLSRPLSITENLFLEVMNGSN